MSITTVPSAITGQTLSAANWNTQVRDNINGIWVLTAAGDIMYAASASSAARLAKPSVASFLRNQSSGVPDWVAATQMPGSFHTNGSNFTNSNTTSASTSYAALGAGVKFDLTLAVTCTIYAWAFGTGYKVSGSFDGYFAISINGTIDPNDNVRLRGTTSIPYSTMYKLAAVPAGTRTVELKYKTANAGDAVGNTSAILYAVAVVD